MEINALNLRTSYKNLKEEAKAERKEENVQVLLINGTPALRVRAHDPITLKYLQDVEEGIDVPELKKQVEKHQSAIDNLNELIKDAEALPNG